MNTIIFDLQDQHYLVLRSDGDVVTGIGTVEWSNDYDLEHIDIKPFSPNKPLSQTLKNYPHWLQLFYQLPFRHHYPELLL